MARHVYQLVAGVIAVQQDMHATVSTVSIMQQTVGIWYCKVV